MPLSAVFEQGTLAAESIVVNERGATKNEALNNALAGLKTELDIPQPPDSDSDGSREHATRAFESKLGVHAADLPAFSEPPSLSQAQTTLRADDGGGPNYSHKTFPFLRETFRSLLFRPNVPVEKEIIRALDVTKKGDRIFLALYEFKQGQVLKALRRARSREVDITIVLDYENTFPPAKKSGSDYAPARSKEIWALAREGFNVKVLRGLGLYGIMHNKIAIIERGRSAAMGIYGSYNWAWAAEDAHYENANFTRNKKRVDFLKATWNWLDSLSEPIVYNRANGTVWLKNPDHQWPQTVSAPPQSPDFNVQFNGILLPAVVASPSPVGEPNIETRLVEAIDATKKTIDISIFSIRSTLIATALARARKRKPSVSVRVIIDKSQAASDLIRVYAEYLAFHKIDVRLLGGPDPDADFQLAQKAHHKFSRFDGKLIETGSPNYSKNASIKNFENGHFINNREEKENIAGYGEIFERMWRRAEEFPAPAVAPTLPTDAELIEELGQTPANSERRLVSAIDGAHKTIHISVLALRSTLIAEALVRAKIRTVTVRVILDENQYKSEFIRPYADWLAYHGISVRTISKNESGFPDIERFAVFDSKITETQLVSHTKFGLMANEAHFSDDTDRHASILFGRLWKQAKPVPAPANAPVLATNAELISEATATFENHEETPGPLPAWPRPTARQITFNDETYPAVIMRPDFPIEPLVVKMIRSARQNLFLSLYEFDLGSVMEALRWLKANRPEVEINIIIDRSHVYTTGTSSTGDVRKPSPQIVALIKEGFKPLILVGKSGGIMHSKYIIVDATAGTGLVFRGSYNIARTAEHNHYENAVISIEKERVLNYMADFRYKKDLAEPVDLDKLDEILSRTDAASSSSENQRISADSQGSRPPIEYFAPGDRIPDAWVKALSFQEHADPVSRGFPAGSGAALVASRRRPVFDDALPSEEALGQVDAVLAPRNPPPSNPATPFDLNGEKFQSEYFSPGGGVLDAWIRAINAAENSIEVAMFSFYSRTLADALVQALTRKRETNPNFKFRLALDAGQSSLAKFDKTDENPKGVPVNRWFKERGVDVVISGGPHPGRDKMFEKMHNKYLIVDGKFVITGSWNASDPAEKFNFENATVLMDLLDVAMFVWDFERIYLRGWAPKIRTLKPLPAPDLNPLTASVR